MTSLSVAIMRYFGAQVLLDLAHGVMFDEATCSLPCAFNNQSSMELVGEKHGVLGRVLTKQSSSHPTADETRRANIEQPA